MGRKIGKDIFDSNDIFRELVKLLELSPIKENIRNIAISTFKLKSKRSLQLEIFEDVIRKEELNKSIDAINKRYGDYTVYSARMILSSDIAKDRIAFGR